MYLISVLAVFALIAALMGFRWYRQMVRYRDVFQDLPDPVLRISVDSFEPVVCNRSFSNLLGYDTPRECCRLFNHNPHLPEQSLHQVWREADASGAESTQVQLNDRWGVTVARVLEVHTDNSSRFMDLIVVALDAPRSLTDLLLEQNVVSYFEIDSELAILNANRHAVNQFALDPDHLCALNEAAFPLDLSDRLTRAYRSRLQRDGRLKLRHRTALAENDRAMGQWWLSAADPGNYHVLFKEDVSTELPIDSPLYDLQEQSIGFWEADLQMGLISHNSSWFTSLQYPQVLSVNPLSFWISLLAPDDRQTVTQLLDRPDSSFSFSYHMATGSGVQIRMETRGFVKERDAEGQPRIVQGIHIDRTSDTPGTSAATDEEDSLSMVAGNLGYRMRGEGDLNLSVRRHLLEAILSDVSEFLQTGYGGEVVKSVSVEDHRDMRCSSCDDDARHAETLTISCAGLPVSPALLPHMLAPGFSASRLDAPDGAGLSRVNQRLHDAGGHLQLTLPSDGDLELALNLPAVGKDAAETILIIDDDPAAGYYVKESVIEAGYAASFSTSSVQALQLFRADPHHFSLVITDQNMPGYSGEEITHAMLQMRPDTPIILCTGDQHAMDRATALAAGATEYLSKPIDVTELLNTIDRCLGRSGQQVTGGREKGLA